MRTREESLEIIRNALGGNISTGSPAGKRVRTRDDSLRILQSAVTEPAPSVILNREAVKNPVNRTPGAENDSPMFPNDVGATLAVARPNGSPTGEPGVPLPRRQNQWVPAAEAPLEAAVAGEAERMSVPPCRSSSMSLTKLPPM